MENEGNKQCQDPPITIRIRLMIAWGKSPKKLDDVDRVLSQVSFEIGPFLLIMREMVGLREGGGERLICMISYSGSKGTILFPPAGSARYDSAAPLCPATIDGTS